MPSFSDRLASVPLIGPALEWLGKHRKKVAAASFTFCHLAGALTSVKAVMETRTSQGAIAWAVSLNTFPYVAVPAYWVFGRSEFRGYLIARRDDFFETSKMAQDLLAALTSEALAPSEEGDRAGFLQNLVKLPTTRGNDVELLIDGEATFDAIFQAIDEAQSYVLVQFYILRADGLGNELKQRLLRKRAEGLRVFVLYDEFGSKDLPRSYIDELRGAGVHISEFHSTQGWANRFQLNFRNHRKIVVVDGKIAFVGGHNVGDEYLGKDPKLSPWRDTHVSVRGPVVQCLQVPFAEDWHWATGQILTDLNWDPYAAPSGIDMHALAIPSGPADPFETCTLFFLDAIHSAQERVWIASPYFVPDEQIVSALQSAALRGVDVHILIPQNADSLLVYLSSFSYLDAAERAGVRISRYQPGFMHQKVVLVDDDFACVGTANFDNRSFRLNFEITLAVEDEAFASAVEQMLQDDFSRSEPTSAADYSEASFAFRLSVKIARLMAPVQ